MYLFGLIGLTTGFILGVFIMKIKNKHLYQRTILQENTLKTNTEKLNEYQKELNNHFNHNITLLDIIANNYQQLYQHIITSSNISSINPNNIEKKIKKPFHSMKYYNNNMKNHNQSLEEAPRDYPENNKS